VDVTLGLTKVSVRVSQTISIPYPDRKFDGIFTIHTELSPISTPAFESNSTSSSSQGDQEAILSRILEKTIRRSNALDTESLCIVAGKKCFHVRVDVHVLDYDGGLVDASCIAVVAGLLHFKRPDVEIKGEDVRIFDPREREPIKLSLNHVPFCVTFRIFRNVGEDGSGGKGIASYLAGEDEIVVVDATLLEEQCSDAEIIIGINKFGEVVQMAKYGGYPVGQMTVIKCIKIAEEKVKVLHDVVMNALAADEKRQDRDGVMAELRADNERIIPG